MAYNPKFHEEIFEDLKTAILSYPGCELTDFSESSNLTAILSAIADVIEEFYVDSSIGWEMIVKDAIYLAMADLTRKQAIKANGTVIFSRSTNAPTDYLVPTGTIVENIDGVQFETTEDGFILTGTSSSGSVSIQALVAGADGNVGASTITSLATYPAGVQFVNNSAATSGGSDLEADESFDKRFRDYVQSLGGGTPLKLKSESERVTGVKSAYIRELFPADGYVTIYIDDGSGSATTLLLNAVNAHLEGTGIPEDPGYRPAGITLNLVAITGVDVDVSATVWINRYANWDTVQTQVNALISEYVESLDQNENVVWSKIIDFIHNNPDVDKVVLTLPTDDVVIAPGEVAIIGVITLTKGT